MADPAAAGPSAPPPDDDALAAGEAEDALALAEPAPDMSRHKSGIIPILQCVAAAARAGPRSALTCCAVRRNLVATVNLDCKLDLKTITLHARNAEYNPKARGCCCLAALGA